MCIKNAPGLLYRLLGLQPGAYSGTKLPDGARSTQCSVPNVRVDGYLLGNNARGFTSRICVAFDIEGAGLKMATNFISFIVDRITQSLFSGCLLANFDGFLESLLR